MGSDEADDRVTPLRPLVSSIRARWVAVAAVAVVLCGTLSCGGVWTQLDLDLDALMWRIVTSVKTWPEHDLF